MRLVTLSLFAALCVDGGHTLQEVLSAAQYSSGHVSKAIRRGDPWTGLISQGSVEALKNLTEELSATGGPEDPGLFGAYHSGFFHRIQEPGFLEARKNAQTKLLRYIARPDACSKTRENSALLSN